MNKLSKIRKHLSTFTHTHHACIQSESPTAFPPPIHKHLLIPTPPPSKLKSRLADFLPFLREQFAYVGPGCVGGEREADPTAAADPFFQETPDTFRLWASGRRHVEVGGCRGVGCVIE